MAEDKITHEQISDNDPFIKVTEGAERAFDSVSKLETELKSVVKTLAKGLGADPKTFTELKGQLEVVRNIEAGEAALNEVNRQKLLLAEKLSEVRLREKRDAMELANANRKKLADEKALSVQRKKAIDEYGKLSARHRELVREAKNLAVAYGAESKEAKKAADEANKLDKQLKKIDASVGQHQRNVGNYASTWQGLNNAFTTLGVTMGVGTFYQGLKSSIVAFVEAEKNAKALEFAITNIAGEGKLAVEQLIAQSEALQGIYSDDDIQKSQTMLANFGLITSEIEESIPVIRDYAVATGRTMEEATDIFIKGVNGKTKALKETGIAFEDTGTAAGNYAKTIEGMTKFEGAHAAALGTTEGKYFFLQNRFDNLKEDMGEWLITGAAGFLTYWDTLMAKIDGVGAEWDDLNRRMASPAQQLIDARLKGMEEAGYSTGMKIVELQRLLGEIPKQTQKTMDMYNKGLISAEDHNEEIALLGQKRLVIEREISKLEASRYNTGDLDFRTGYGNGDQTKEDAEDYVYTWEDALKEVAEFDAKMDADERRRHEEKLRRERHRHEQKMRQLREEQEMLDQIEKVRARVDETHYLITTTADQRRRDDIAKEEARRIRDLDYLHDRGLISEKDYQDELTRIQADAEKKRLQMTAETVAEQMDKMLSGVDEGYERRFEAIESSIQREGEMIDEQLRIQSERQINGQDNTYSQTLRLKEENDAKLAALEDARRRKEEAKDFAELFIELTKGYAQKGDGNAASKAFAEAIAIKALSNVIAGNFADGVENFKGKGGPKDDANLIGFSAGESVVTAKGTADTPGLVSAVNESGKQGAIDWALNEMYNPQYRAALTAEGGEVRRGDWYGSALLNEIVELKQVIKDKPENNWGYDHTKKAFMHISKQGGKTTVRIKKY